MRIAVVEDDDGLGDALVDALTEVGHTPVRMRRGADALLGYHDMDVVLLDLGLPDMDGLEVLRKLRTLSSVPVVVLTARDDERSVVRALRGGADDYVVKPARLGELHARLEVAAHRRSSATGPAADRLTLGDVVVDLSGRAVEVGGRAVALTTKEFDLLAHLASRRSGEPGTVDGRHLGRRLRRDLTNSRRPYDGVAFQARSPGRNRHHPRLRLPLGHLTCDGVSCWC